ncbi:MAG: hypothetical protein ACK56I_14010, partial [bacterium]
LHVQRGRVHHEVRRLARRQVRARELPAAGRERACREVGRGVVREFVPAVGSTVRKVERERAARALGEGARQRQQVGGARGGLARPGHTQVKEPVLAAVPRDGIAHRERAGAARDARREDAADRDRSVDRARAQKRAAVDEHRA